MRRELTSFIQKLLGKFVQVKAFKDVAVTEVDMNDPTLFLDDSKIIIGYTTRQAMKSNNFLPLEEAAVIQSCRSFFIAAYEYSVSPLPLANEVLKHAEVLQVESRETASFESLEYFVNKFPTLKARLKGKMGKLYDQFISYQLLRDSVVA